MTRPISAALLAALLTLSAGPAAAALTIPRARGASETVPGELIVKFKPGASAQGRAAALAATGHATISTLGDLGAEGWTHVRVAPGQTDAQALAAYAGDPNVEFAQPNFIYRASAAPDDAQYGQLWGWRNIGQAIGTANTQPAGTPIGYTTANPGASGADMNLQPAWDLITDCRSVVVAVLDSGVNYTHVDLAANMWNGNAEHGRNFAGTVSGSDAATTTDPMDLNGHGTHVAGTIGAVGNNGIGVTGVCWTATIMAVRVLAADGAGTSSGIIQGIDYAVQNGAKVLNMSLGGGGTLDAAYSAAIGRAQAADVVVVVAAGNDGKDNEATPVYPCNFPNPNLICVAALDQAFGMANFSNWGSTSVDVGAPGTNIVSAWPGPVYVDPLNAGWSASSSTATGWDYVSLALQGGGTLDLIGVPSPFNTAGVTYANNSDDRAYAAFSLAGASRTIFTFSAIVDVAANDIFRVGFRAGLADPFVGGTVIPLTDAAGYTNWPDFEPITLDLSTCGSGNCAIGFQLQSDGVAQTSKGIGIADFTLHGIYNNSTSYNTENGTSMATPAVAGLATMLRAFHGPSFTATDVIGAIKGGGWATASLSGRTTTGRAADAMGALAFINPPKGVTAVVR